MKKAIQPVRPNYDEANYDKTKIAPFKLEKVLQFADGTPVKTAADWPRRRRELVDLFAREMYGIEPPEPKTLVTELVEEKEGALGGFSVRSQYRMYFKKNKRGPAIDWLIYRPRYAKTPSPVILFLNYQGNHELTFDEEIPIPDTWYSFNKEHKVPQKRGVMCDPCNATVLPIGILLSAGYAVMSACYSQISPDPGKDADGTPFQQEKFAYTGVFDLWGKRDDKRDDNTTALGAWAWGLSRGLDLAERIPQIDAKRNIVTGCSRLAKSALLAASRDERFAVCVPIQCGGGGVTLAKRDYGENIGTEMKAFRHWYCPAYKKYEKNPAKQLTFDQHLLAATIAPRKLLIGGFDSPWFDTEGEYLALKAASPAWELFGLPGLPKGAFPDDFDTKLIGPYLGYYRRSEEHGIAAFDWFQLLRFAK